MTPLNMPSINITNVLPGQPHQASPPDPEPGSEHTVQSSGAIAASHLDIPGLRDVALRRYTLWQQSKVEDPSLKDEYRKAQEAVLEEGLDLVQIYKYQDPGYFRKRGVKRGPAEHFVEDIPVWVEEYKRVCI